MAEEKIDNALGEVKNIMENKREDWVCHSQAIAAAMSNRMELLGMTQKALAMKMNCSQQYISKVLKDGRICHWKLCARLKKHWMSKY